jgi:hypothetical protein
MVATMSTSWHLIGNTSDLWKLVQSPVAWPKVSSSLPWVFHV